MRFRLDSRIMLAANIVAGVLQMGCATRAVQTEHLLETFRNLGVHEEMPRRSEVPGVSFIEQSEGYCGPATLAMTFAWAGKSVPVSELVKQVYTPSKKGTMPADLVGATRRQGLMGVQFNGLATLIDEVAAGRPVIIFENLALTWYPRWHYAVAYGYDLDQETITLHSGSQNAKKWSLHKFERSWMLGEYWGLVVLPPGQISVSSGELANSTAASGLEQVEKTDEAEKSYHAILDKWPTSLGALIGLGNIAYSKKDFAGSVDVLSRASAAHPNLSVVWHNLATALGALADSQRTVSSKSVILSARTLLRARESAKRAIELASAEDVSGYRLSLAKWLTHESRLKIGF